MVRESRVEEIENEENNNRLEDIEIPRVTVEQGASVEASSVPKPVYSKDESWQKIKRYLAKNNIRAAATVGKRSVLYPSLIEDFTCIIHLQIKRNLFIVKIRYPIAVPKEKRIPLTAELAKINFAMLIGSFQIDMSDGEITFFHANTIGTKLKESVIGRNIGICKMTVHQNAKRLARFIFADPARQNQSTSPTIMQQIIHAIGNE